MVRVAASELRSATRSTRTVATNIAEGDPT